MRPFFVVMAPNYAASSGGIRALHKIRRCLDDAGEDAYITADRGEKPLTRDALCNLLSSGRKMVGIYPEVFGGNPLNADIVVRWMLNIPMSGQEQTFGEDDIICHWMKEFSYGQSEELSVPIIDESIFNEDEAGERTLVLKYALKLRANGLEPFGEGIDLTPGFGPVTAGDQATIANLLRRAKVLILFEESSLATEAALCGCPVLYVRTSYLTNVIDGMFGERFDDEEIEKARSMIPASIKKYRDRCAASMSQVSGLVSRVYGKLNGVSECQS
jgi:hypothetical protein